MSLPPSFNLLKQYPNPVYVECGVWRGDSIQQAIDAGFERIIGFDNDPESIAFCTQRFGKQATGCQPYIKLMECESIEGLKILLNDPKFKMPMTFFLDAHFQLIEGTARGADPFPLLGELYQIGKHSIRTHTIIIDDLLYLTHPEITGWTRDQIVKEIQKINKKYEFTLVSNPVINNMLVAWIP